jgi:hypothetical protein
LATLPDLILTGATYQDCNTLTGIIAGSPIVIQNKSSNDVRVIINPTQPAASSENGWLLAPRASIVIENETQVVWAKAVALGNSHISVQPFV